MTLVSENFEGWLDYLDEATEPQVAETLVSDYDRNGEKFDDGKVGYCCLGIACLIAPEEIGGPYLGIGDHTLLPVKVADWLGLGRYWKGESDGSYDWYQMMMTGGDVDIHVDYPYPLPETDQRPLTAAGLNDSGCTFKQIAQVLRYFGVKEVTG